MAFSGTIEIVSAHDCSALRGAGRAEAFLVAKDSSRRSVATTFGATYQPSCKGAPHCITRSFFTAGCCWWKQHVAVRTKRWASQVVACGPTAAPHNCAASAGSCSKVKFLSLLLILLFVPVSFASSPCFLLGVAYAASVTEFASDG